MRSLLLLSKNLNKSQQFDPQRSEVEGEEEEEIFHHRERVGNGECDCGGNGGEEEDGWESMEGDCGWAGASMDGDSYRDGRGKEVNDRYGLGNEDCECGGGWCDVTGYKGNHNILGLLAYAACLGCDMTRTLPAKLVQH